MIPPIAPGQGDGQQDMVGWKNTFNMRQVTLMNLAASNMGSRNGVRNDIQTYIRTGCITSPVKSLDILRRNLQSAINKDIDNVIKKYLEKFFQPAVNNIRANQGKASVNEDHIKDVCRQILEDAKQMYKTYMVSRDSSPYDFSDTEDNRLSRMGQRKRKESDTDSETGNGTNPKRHKYRSSYISDNQIHKLPLKREGPKWDPDRITTNTLFIMGARANKVLGFGQTRGRLYVRHPELVRYSGDQEDKEWLASKNLMPPSGGKAYLMVLDDIRELTQLDEYRNSPNLQLGELKGFELPSFIVNKIKHFIECVRTDKHKLDIFDFHRSHSVTPPNPVDSAPSTPSDTMQMLESQSVSTTSSKHSDNNYIHIPEMSPGSNNSFMSGPLTQSPVPTSTNLISPNMLMGITSNDLNHNNGVMILPDSSHNENSLSNLLASHMSSDNSQDF